MDTGTGKLFTNVIAKEKVGVVIQTRTNKITGVLHKRKQDRVTDLLNQPGKFIALTDVVVYDEKGAQKIHTKDFMAINLNEIVWLVES
jgi:hypothetical protein